MAEEYILCRMMKYYGPNVVNIELKIDTSQDIIFAKSVVWYALIKADR